MKNYWFTGPLFICIAASLWAADGIFRSKLSVSLAPELIVLFEHVIAAAILLPHIKRSIVTVRSFSATQWLATIGIAVLASALGTILFTKALALSFATGDFVTPILLQKLQPLFALLLAWVCLRERMPAYYVLLVPLALVGSYLISFGAQIVPFAAQEKWLVISFAVGAAACWGSGTVMGRFMSQSLDFWQLTSLRYAFAIPVLLVYNVVAGNLPLANSNMPDNVILNLATIAIVTGGVISLGLYYFGLQRTKASVATLAEMTFLIVSVLISITVLNPYGAPQVLSWANMLGIGLLAVVIIVASKNNTSNKKWSHLSDSNR